MSACSQVFGYEFRDRFSKEIGYLLLGVSGGSIE